MLNKPLKFIPILKEKIWGGTKLHTVLNKKSKAKNLGESWEISDVSGDMSVVAKGEYKGITLSTMISKFKEDLVGKKVYDTFGTDFPLLIKFIDAKEALSIQLHPNDELAKKRHNSFGKTEMWYVMQADKEANLIVGFKKQVNKELYQEYLKNKDLLKILNVEKVEEGDVFFIPTGRVHAIGAGVLLAEIQQTSDITYRIYDWDRQDTQGNYRELHTKNALEAIDFEVKNTYKTKYNKYLNKHKLIVNCPYFTTNIIQVKGVLNVDQSKKDSFIIYMCVKGNVIFANDNFKEELVMGETLLIPNSLTNYQISANNLSELLEVYID